ncbi:MAG: hypothetical protein IKM10_06875 [Bacteroidaceae bacterium]|nr:hypothetical protein [Bacteroidaceae bacterium]
MNNTVYIEGITSPTHILCSTPDGVVLYNNETDGNAGCTFDVAGYKGVLIIRFDRQNESQILKVIVK